MKHYLCCSNCKGMMPAFKCKWRDCDCHVQQMRVPETGRPLYADKTAETAIGNLSRRHK